MFALTTALFLFLSPAIAQSVGTTSSPATLAAPVQAFLDSFESKHIFFNEYMHNHYFQSKTKSDTAVVFLPGMGEPAIKYYELAQDLKGEFTMYLWDHIGQGHSYHFVPLESEKVHIDSFDTHIGALTHFLTQVRKSHKHIVLIAHSMGGHIALRTLLQHPELGDSVVLTAPLMEINTKWVPIHFVAWLAGYLPADYYPPLHSLFRRGSENGSYTTTSKERMATYRQTQAVYPEIKRSGATLGWVKQAVKSLKDFDEANVDRLTVPVFILQAEHDFLVSNPAQAKACQRISNCKLQIVPESRHELLFENDKPRGITIKAINDFISQRK